MSARAHLRVCFPLSLSTYTHLTDVNLINTNETMTQVTPKLSQAFVDAQKGAKRCVIVKIKEEKLVLADTMDRSGEEQDDFDSMNSKVGKSDTAFLLFQLDSGRWLFVSYIPDSSKVRDKMLYASSIDDLQDQLGKGFFEDTFKVSDKSELSYDQWKRTLRRQSFSGLMTEKERVVREEQMVDKNTTSSGMKTVLFPMASEVLDSFKDLSNGDRSVVMIRIRKKKGGREECVLDNLKDGAVVDDLLDASGSEPRYVVTSEKAIGYLGNGFVFAFFCPEGAKAMNKMMYATAKKAVSDTAADILGKLVANVEIDDISTLRSSARKAIDFTDQSTQQTHEMAFKKPVAAKRRKRRGKRGLIKKPL
jgi:twinfilin